MPEDKLEETLRPIVLQYGFEQVERCLQEMETTVRRRRGSGRPERSETSPGRGTEEKYKKKNSRITAQEYASKMEIPSEKVPMVAELARKFENKSFLPTLWDIRNFCQLHGIDEPASSSRVGAVPRIFKCIAAMETDDIREILESGMFSGPSRLGPIADAIRRRNARHETAAQTPTSSSPRPDREVDGLQSRS